MISFANIQCCTFLFFYCCSSYKGTISSEKEQTFNMAWNRCPSLRWTQWLEITGAFMQQQWSYHAGYYFQSMSKSNTTTIIPCPVDRDETVPLKQVIESVTVISWIRFGGSSDELPTRKLSPLSPPPHVKSRYIFDSLTYLGVLFSWNQTSNKTREMYRLMKFLLWMINNWLDFALTPT